MECHHFQSCASEANFFPELVWVRVESLDGKLAVVVKVGLWPITYEVKGSNLSSLCLNVLIFRSATWLVGGNVLANEERIESVIVWRTLLPHHLFWGLLGSGGEE